VTIMIKKVPSGADDGAGRYEAFIARRSIRKAGTALILMSLMIFAGSAITSAAGKVPDACGLLSRAEIQSALGAAPAGMVRAITFRQGTTSLCQGRIGGVTLTVRISARSTRDSDDEAAIGQMIIAGGGKVNTVRTGGMTCTTILPAAPMAAEYGYDSLCTLDAGEREVAVQTETHDLDALVPVAKLAPLVGVAAMRLAGSR
jgi:hypothetical protein